MVDRFPFTEERSTTWNMKHVHTSRVVAAQIFLPAIIKSDSNPAENRSGRDCGGIDWDQLSQAVDALSR